MRRRFAGSAENGPRDRIARSQGELTGPPDGADAIIELKPGAGGTDATGLGAMLLRMYLRWAEKNGFKAEIEEEQRVMSRASRRRACSSRGPTPMVYSGRNRGTPFSTDLPIQRERKATDFVAAVEVTPVVDLAEAVNIDPKAIAIDVYRASGAGRHARPQQHRRRCDHRTYPTGHRRIPARTNARNIRIKKSR
jgi:peptide chain release factor 2